MWKFHDFSITEILRESNYAESRSAKSAILTHLGALNFAILVDFSLAFTQRPGQTNVQNHRE